MDRYEVGLILAIAGVVAGLMGIGYYFGDLETVQMMFIGGCIGFIMSR